jgi:hypothetical protein
MLTVCNLVVSEILKRAQIRRWPHWLIIYCRVDAIKMRITRLVRIVTGFFFSIVDSSTILGSNGSMCKQV